MGFKELAMQRDLVRKTDPRSSHIAANRMVESGAIEGQCRQVYEALKRYPNRTAKELARDSGLDYILIQKRLSVLEKKGYAKRRGDRLCTVSKTGIPATVWDLELPIL